MNNHLPVAVQVYGLRDLLENTPENFRSVMEKVREIGYDGVELAGTYGLEPAFIKELKERRIAVWVNAITMSNGEEWSNISAHHDDDGAVLGDADAHWGWLIDHGADVVQTDWPALLYCYLRQRFPGTRPELMAKN